MMGLLPFFSFGVTAARLTALPLLSGTSAPSTSLTVNFSGNQGNATRRIVGLWGARRQNDSVSQFSSFSFTNGVDSPIAATIHDTSNASNTSDDRSLVSGVFSAIVPNNSFTTLTNNGIDSQGWGIQLFAVHGLANGSPTSVSSSSAGSIGGSTIHAPEEGDTFNINEGDIVLALAAGYGGGTGHSWNTGTEVLDTAVNGTALCAIGDGAVAAQGDASYTCTFSASQNLRVASIISWG